MMLTLQVSHDAGLTYTSYCHAKTVAGIAPLLEDLNEQGLRWYIANESGDPVGPMCDVHLDTLAVVVSLQRAEGE